MIKLIYHRIMQVLTSCKSKRKPYINKFVFSKPQENVCSFATRNWTNNDSWYIECINPRLLTFRVASSILFYKLVKLIYGNTELKVCDMERYGFESFLHTSIPLYLRNLISFSFIHLPYSLPLISAYIYISVKKSFLLVAQYPLETRIKPICLEATVDHLKSPSCIWIAGQKSLFGVPYRVE